MDKIKVLQFGPLDLRKGGPTLSTYLTVKGLMQNNMDVEVLTYHIEDRKYLIGQDVKAIFMDKSWNERFKYVPTLPKQLKSLSQYDIYHIQGLQEYPCIEMAKKAKSEGAPYLLTLRGLLYPQAMSVKPFVKKMAMRLYANKLLRNAACIQATCKEEMEFYREYGFKNPVAIIPNPIETDGIIERPIKSPEKFRIGYIGRIHPRKRIERLIYAFDAIKERGQNCELLIIGADVPEYEQFLKDEVARLHLENVRFTGFLKGKEKDEALCSLSYLMVPSDFENFGNIVSEALVRGVPVVTSRGMPWQILEEYHCGWWIDNNQASINKMVEELLRIPEPERIQMGENGKKLIMNEFSIPALGKKMSDLYRWVLKQGEKPSFVYTSE